MKYLLIILSTIALILFLGYKYVDYKIVNAQEASFIEMSEVEFDESQRTFPDSVRMQDAQFWGLIDHSKKKFPESFHQQMDFLTQQLATLSDEEIIGFEATLREKIIELWDYKVKSLYQIMFENYMSVDSFIYFRFWLVSNGQDFYVKALKDPEQLSEIIQATYDGERLMGVADEAFALKNGSNAGRPSPRDINQDVDYDFGNYKMTGEYIAPSEFKKRFPKLVRKF